MTIAFFPQSLVFDFPNGLFLAGLIGILVLGLVEVRKGYIGRPAIFVNALLLWQIFYPVLDLIPVWLNWYLNIGSIVGLTALISYFPITRFKLPNEFYKFAFFFYGSLSIIIVIISSIYFKIPLI